MPALRNSRTLAISIDCPVDRVYNFVSNPENLPLWATAFVRSVRKSGSEWVVETSVGPVGIQFASRNEFGVLDHTARLPSGDEIMNPMRVVPNGSGSELLFTLFQLPGMSDEQFAEDAEMVERDLRTLKGVLEA